MSRAAVPVDLVAASLELPTHPVEYAPYAPLRGCDAVANFWCDKNCPHYAEFGSLLARYDQQIVPDQPLAWRCYARHTLDDAEQKYTMGKAYCTRERELRGIIDACVAKRESQRIMGESASAVAVDALGDLGPPAAQPPSASDAPNATRTDGGSSAADAGADEGQAAGPPAVDYQDDDDEPPRIGLVVAHCHEEMAWLGEMQRGLRDGF